MLVPAGSSITTITWYDAPGEDDTFLPSQDSAASPAALSTTVSAGKSYPIPTDLYGAGALKLVADASGSVDVTLSS